MQFGYESVIKGLVRVLPLSSKQQAPQMVPFFLWVKREMDQTVSVTCLAKPEVKMHSS